MRIKAAFVIFAVSIATLGCGGSRTDQASNDPEGSGVTTPQSQAENVRGGGGIAPQYAEPVQLVPGKYVSPAGLQLAADRGLVAATAERAQPRFEGKQNGFRVYSYDPATDPISKVKVWCGGGEVKEFPLDDRLSYAYLPPGTAALSPQSASVCEDGTVQQVQQRFITYNASFDIYYQSGERAFQADAPAGRVASATIAGQPGLVIRPVTDEGFGRSSSVFATDHGFIVVDARDLPLNEVMKIAEGVKCDAC